MKDYKVSRTELLELLKARNIFEQMESGYSQSPYDLYLYDIQAAKLQAKEDIKEYEVLAE